jgi:opacity protein-like surface antigen
VTPRFAVLALAGSALLAAASPALADDRGFGIEGQVGYQDLTHLKSSAKAVFDGSSGGVTFGGGVRYIFGNRFYVAGWGRSFSKDGERVFITDASSTVFPLGHPLSISIVPIQATIGYRFGKGGRITPYVGVGGGVTKYHEESTVGGETTKDSETKGSGHILGGVEVGHGSLRFGAEVGYAFVPNALGIGGVSKIYNESDIGGFSVVGKLVFTFGGR